MTNPARARSFEKAAASYAANRPSYPPALFDAIEELTGRPLRGARVADVGAGTGLATTVLHARGADVVAVEPGFKMASQLRLGLPEVPLVLGVGDCLPLATDSRDLLTYAQAWHWTDPRDSVPEARRVLVPGGSLALWWNDSDITVPWIHDQEVRLRQLFGAEDKQPDPMARFGKLPAELSFHTRQVSWTRAVSLDTHLANLASFSDFLVLGEEGTGEFLAQERERLTDIFPTGPVEERYVVSLALTTF